MIRTGLVSITFRKFSPQSIIDLVVQTGLGAIEWGGDVHVPHGDLDRAREVAVQTRDAGLDVACYGSYYYVGAAAKNHHTFDAVLATALALGAPMIRVWAGDHGSKATSEAAWAKVVEESRQIGEKARAAGVSLAFEFHGNTLNDTSDSAMLLQREINHPNVFTLWQPNSSLERRENQRELRRVLPWLANIHVFYFRHGIRLPLEDGIDEWKAYLLTARRAKPDFTALIELVQHDAPSNFIRDARILNDILAYVEEQPLQPDSEEIY